MSAKTSLFNLLKKYNSPHVLEIGVAQGESAFAMLDKFSDLTYTGVDEWLRRVDMEHEANKIKNWSTQKHWDAIHDRVCKLLAPFGDRQQIVREDSKTALPKLEDLYDVIFVDGDHSYTGCLVDLQNSLPLLREGGSIWVDDLNLKSVKRAFDAFLDLHPDLTYTGCSIKHK